MSNTYIKFKSSGSSAQKAPENIGKRLVNPVLTTPPPVANPDFENRICRVTYWLIEFENDSYYPNREIGLDSFEKPLMIMPWGKNYGYWTDNNLVIEDFRSHFESVDINKEEFEKYWKLFPTETL